LFGFIWLAVKAVELSNGYSQESEKIHGLLQIIVHITLKKCLESNDLFEINNVMWALLVSEVDSIHDITPE
jgi:hypothetical protein